MENENTSEVITARRTESLDAATIQKLVKSSTTDLFGRVNVINLIEKAALAVTLCNEEDTVHIQLIFSYIMYIHSLSCIISGTYYNNVY